MSGGTLLFSTDLRTGYADVAALQAALTAGTHPAGFANTSDAGGDLAQNIAFDDVVQYLGQGTLKITGFWALDYLGGPFTDAWVKQIVRFSPTLNFDNFTSNMGAIVLYDDNVNWAHDLAIEIVHRFNLPSNGMANGFGYRDDGAQGALGGPVTQEELRSGQWQEIVTHTVRGAEHCVFQTWINRVLRSTVTVDVPPGFPDTTNLEYSVGSGHLFNEAPNADDYQNLALLEAYEGGDPYGLLIRKPGSLARTARNATQCAPEDASLWSGLGLALPAVEGAGDPLELVGNTTLALPAGVTWADQEGKKVLRFDGTGGLSAVAPIINQSTEWTVAAIIRSPAPAAGFLDVYAESQDPGDGDSYVTVGLNRDNSILTADTWDDPLELYGSTDTPHPDFEGLRVVLWSRSGDTLTMMADGVSLSVFHSPQDNVTIPAMLTAVIGPSFEGDIAGLFVWPTRVLTALEIARWNTQPFGLATRAWRKPAPGAYDPAKSEAPALAAGLGLLVVANEGVGNPKNVVTDEELPITGGVTWVTTEGAPALRFDGSTGYIELPAPIIGEATDYSLIAVLRNNAPGASSGAGWQVYKEVPAGGSNVSYNTALYLYGEGGGPTETLVASDEYDGATNDELYNATHGGVADIDFSMMRVVVIRRVGANLMIWVDGEQMGDQPPNYVAGNVSIVPTRAFIGTGLQSTGPDTFDGRLDSDLALLAVAPGVAWTDEQIGTLSADPFIVARQIEAGDGASGVRRRRRRVLLAQR